MSKSTHILGVVLSGTLFAAFGADDLAQPDGVVQTVTVATPHSGDWFDPAIVNPVSTTETSKPRAPGANPCDNWPVNLGLSGSGYPYTPTLYDADGDGADEIFLTGGHTFGLRGDGSFLPGWPTGEM